jgi:uncharacterized membrane protein YedE/YeeE
MGSAMAVGFIGVRLLRRFGARTLEGQAVTWSPTKPARNHVLGSVLFGLGWSLACTCPGPAAALIGQGRVTALWVVAGILGGVAIRAWVTERRAETAKVSVARAIPGL